MGLAASHGGLHIDLENPNVTAGSEITGVIHLVVKETAPAHSLELWLKGKEYTHYTEKQGNDTNHYYGNREVLRWKIPIYAFSEGKVDPGHYIFPFTLPTPSDLPGSFNFLESFLGSKQNDGYIAYSIGAKVNSPAKLISKSKIPISVTQTIYHLEVNQPHERTVNVSTWCCFSQGSVYVHSDTDKSSYTIGENAVTGITVLNSQGELPVTHFKASLVRTIVLRTNHGSKTFSTAVSTFSVPKHIGPHNTDRLSETLSLPITSDGQQTSTVDSQLIQCKYEIKGEAVLDGCLCCEDSPQVAKQVVISPIFIPKTQPPTFPEDWQAIVRVNSA